MSKSRGSAQRGRRIAVVVALATTCGAVFLGLAGTANAGNLIVCGGAIKPLNKKKPTDEAKYTIQCNEDIRGYSITATQKFVFFGTEVDVLPNVNQSAVIQCEGSVPGFGFGCGVVDQFIQPNCGVSGKPACTTGVAACGQQTAATTTPKCNNRVDAGNKLSGEVHFAKSPCEITGRLRAWVSAVSTPITASTDGSGTPSAPKPDKYNTGVYGSQPFALASKGWSAKACARAARAEKGKKGKK